MRSRRTSEKGSLADDRMLMAALAHVAIVTSLNIPYFSVATDRISITVAILIYAIRPVFVGTGVYVDVVIVAVVGR